MKILINFQNAFKRIFMAILIPSLATCEADMQSGEKKIANIIRSKLDDDCYCWYNVAVGKEHEHADFIILNPKWGILVLEVKDWNIETIIEADKDSFTLHCNTGRIRHKNPLEQARKYAFSIKDKLMTDECLLISNGKYEGSLCFPYAYGVIFSRITDKQFNQKRFGNTSLNDIFEGSPLVLCSNKFTNNSSKEEIQASLNNMFKFTPSNHLSTQQIKCIRWHIFPDIRANRKQVEYTKQPSLFTVREVMDISQELIARNMGTGHRIIHGAAGSGKTMLLCHRAQHFDKYLDEPILVLCFSNNLVDYIKDCLHQKDVSNKVKVQTFHSWCISQLKNAGVCLPDENDSSFFSLCVDKVKSSVDNGVIPIHQYGAILIDEGNDFEEVWFKLAVKMVKPEHDNLLVLYDSAQSIFNNKKKIKTFSSVGIQARGRTSILRVNYRNTYEIFTLAKRLAENVLQAIDDEEDNIPLVEPVCADVHGKWPKLIYQPSLEDEYESIATLIKAKYLNGFSWQDIAIITRKRKKMHKDIQAIFEKLQIPISNKENKDGIKLLTMHSSKGLEFPLVYIPAVGHELESSNSTDEEERLLYIAMTRATEELVMTHGDNSYFAPKIKAILAELEYS